MNERPPLQTRRWVRVGLALAIAGNLIGAGGAMYLLGGSHGLSVDEAVRRYRTANTDATAAPSTTASTSPGAASSPGTKASTKKAGAPATKSKAKTASGGLVEPKTGVYVYATEGYEETDALSGQRHDYPSQTTITISTYGCGVRFRWQPLKERWDESDGCLTDAGVVLSRFAIYHEFFKRGALEDFACDSDAVVMPSKPIVGDTWRWKGHSDDSDIDTLTTMVGFETVTVGDDQIRTMHVRYETDMTGANEGRQVQDRWLGEHDGLLIRMITSVDAKVDTPFGKANYTERYQIDLSSTTPIS